MSLIKPTFSISITINNKKILILNNNSINIDEYMEIIKKNINNKNNIELTVFLVDYSSTNYHQYEFEYLLGNKNMTIDKWILTNIMYSIKCDKTKSNIMNEHNSKLFCVLVRIWRWWSFLA